MCLAIYKPSNITISKDRLESGFDSNPHGAGFAYNSPNGLVVEKGFFDFKDFYEAISKQEQNQMLIHFRWATHGEKNQFNCHPWKIEHKSWSLAVIHNGILQIESSQEMSDTGHFVHGWLEPLLKRHSRNIWKDHVFKSIAESFIGDYNKMVLMDSDGNWTIYNEEKGHWDGGSWYSNSDYKPKAWEWADREGNWEWSTSGYRLRKVAEQSGCCPGVRVVTGDGMVSSGSARAAAEAALGLSTSVACRKLTPAEEDLLDELEKQKELELARAGGETQANTTDQGPEEEEEEDEQAELLEDYLGELEEEDQGLWRIAVKEIEDYEARGFSREEAMRMVLV